MVYDKREGDGRDTLSSADIVVVGIGLLHLKVMGDYIRSIGRNDVKSPKTSAGRQTR
jgi:hypothetical protein